MANIYDRAKLVRVEGLLAPYLGDLKGPVGSLREYFGPCPVCGGTDTFHYSERLNRFFCRKTYGAVWHDVLDLAIHLGMAHDRYDAAKLLTDNKSLPRLSSAPRPLPPDPAWTKPGWQESARRLLTQAYANREGRDKFLSHRGIVPATADLFGLGYLPAYWNGRAEGKRAVITLPWVNDENMVTAIQFRFIPDGDEILEQRYTSMKGGRKYLFGMQLLAGKSQVLFLEGELNAISAYMVIGSKWDVLSIGSEEDWRKDTTRQIIESVIKDAQKVMFWVDKEKVAKDIPVFFQGAQAFSNNLDANDLLQAGMLWSFLKNHL